MNRMLAPAPNDAVWGKHGRLHPVIDMVTRLGPCFLQVLELPITAE